MNDRRPAREDTRQVGFDLIVIGAGSAGFSAAITAAELGAEVLLIGHGTVGGTCVNVGCVPSKTLVRAAQALHDARSAVRFSGLGASARLDDWGRLRAEKEQLCAELRQRKYVDLLTEYDRITYRTGRARLGDAGVVVDGEHLASDKIVIATGSAPALPDLAGAADVPYLTSTSAMDLTELPGSLLVLGAGYVGCELAQTFSRFGVSVTLVTRSRLLPGVDPEVSAALEASFRDEGIEVFAGMTYRRIRQTGSGVELTVERGGVPRQIRAQRVLYATGRAPETAGLGLTEFGIERNVDGGVRVDAYMRTSRPGVYAAGDVTGQDLYVYMAAYGARIAARNAIEGDRLRYDNRLMPWVVFTDPQVAGVGMTEAEATAAGYQPVTATLALDQLPRAIVARDTRGLVKLVADRHGKRLLGAQILAPEGGDSIQTMALALRQEMTVRELAETVFPYLTTVEGLRLAAQSFDRDIAKLSCCAG